MVQVQEYPHNLYATKLALQYSDYVIKFEDLSLDTERTISDLLLFANIMSYNIDEYKDLVRPSKTIGKGKEYYKIFDTPEFDFIKQLGYSLE